MSVQPVNAPQRCRRRLLSAPALGLALALGAWSACLPLAAARTSDDPSPLAGPKVNEQPGEKSPAAPMDAMTPRTLVERDFEGKLRRLEVSPALAALELLSLSDEERQATQRILDERNMLMDELVQDHLKEITQLAGAFQSGDRAAGMKLLKPLIEDSAELRARGKLVDELAGALTEANAKELQRLTLEYTRALVNERMKDGNPQQPGKKLSRLEAGGYEYIAGLGQEIKRSYERVFALQAKDFDDLLAKLSLTPEQDSKIRALVTDLVQKTYGKSTQAQQTKVFLDAYAVLDADQRKVLLEEVRKRQGLRAVNRLDRVTTPGGEGTSGESSSGKSSPSKPTPGKPAPGKDDVPMPAQENTEPADEPKTAD